MATPHYVVKSVGSHTVFVRNDSAALTQRTFAGIGSLGLLKFALRHDGLLAAATAVAGGLLGFYALTGVNAVDLVRGEAGPTEGDDSPSYRGQDEGFVNSQSPSDMLDEASMESFPASDPPARTSSTGAGGGGNIGDYLSGGPNAR